MHMSPNSIPKHFFLTFYSSGQGIYRNDPVHINIIKSNGDVIAVKTTASEAPLMSPKTKLKGKRVKIGVRAVKRIYQTLLDEKFFDLKHEYKDERVMDGDSATISVSANNRKYIVTTINISVGAFDRIAKAINKELPEGNKVHYNALDFSNIKGLFKRVER